MVNRFYIWVTSNCNLSCKWCSQKFTISQNRGYEMYKGEVDYIVYSCLGRNIHFDIIELTGGEASLWSHLEYGYSEFMKIADSVTMVTNGNNPERVKALGMKEWIVSASQATEEQLKKYDGCPVKLNTHSHKKPPEKPLSDVLPAKCCVSITPDGRKPQNAMEYIRGKVYYCCDAFAHSEYVNEDVSYDFEDDFIMKFSDKKYDKKMCRYCLCNNKVWNKL